MSKLEIKQISGEYYLIISITDLIKTHIKLNEIDIKTLNVDIKNIIKNLE